MLFGKFLAHGLHIFENRLQGNINIMGHNRRHLTHRRHLVALDKHIFTLHALGYIVDQNNHAGITLIVKRVDSNIKMVLTALAVFNRQGFIFILSLFNLRRCHRHGWVGFPEVFAQYGFLR